MGCDISEKGSGICDAGKEAFLKALKSFDEKDSSQLTPRNFAQELRTHAKPQCRLSYSVDKIAAELNRVCKWFSSDASFYDVAGNMRTVSGAIVKSSSRATRRHMRGELDPKSATEFTSTQKRQIESIEVHNLVHNSAARRESINGLSLPQGRDTVASCKVEELKAIVIARGGGVTGRDGKALNKVQLQKIVRAYLSMEAENSKHTVYFNRSRVRNGIFASIDTSQK